MMIGAECPGSERSLYTGEGEGWAKAQQVLAWGRELLEGRWQVVRRRNLDGHLVLVFGPRSRLLTSGEQQVLRAVVEGYPSKRIALELGLARSTVSQRLASATVALGFLSRTELLLCAARVLAAKPATVSGDAALVNAKELRQRGERSLLFHFRIAEAPLPRVLTRAEQAVVHGVFAGMSNAAIAAARGASPHTVANQLAKIYRKLRVGSRWELMTRFPKIAVVSEGLPA